MPEVMNDAAEPKATGRTVTSSDVAPARLLAATAQVMGRLSATVKVLTPAASVDTCWPSRRTVTETAPVTCQDTVTSCPTSGLPALHLQEDRRTQLVRPLGEGGVGQPVPGQGQENGGENRYEQAYIHAISFIVRTGDSQPWRGRGHGAVFGVSVY